jgi:hypothetical protein
LTDAARIAAVKLMLEWTTPRRRSNQAHAEKRPTSWSKYELGNSAEGARISFARERHALTKLNIDLFGQYSVNFDRCC